MNRKTAEKAKQNESPLRNGRPLLNQEKRKQDSLGSNYSQRIQHRGQSQQIINIRQPNLEERKPGKPKLKTEQQGGGFINYLGRAFKSLITSNVEDVSSSSDENQDFLNNEFELSMSLPVQREKSFEQVKNRNESQLIFDRKLPPVVKMQPVRLPQEEFKITAESEKRRMLQNLKSELTILQSDTQKEYFKKVVLAKRADIQLRPEFICQMILADTSKKPATVDNRSIVYPEVKKAVRKGVAIVLKDRQRFVFTVVNKHRFQNLHIPEYTARTYQSSQIQQRRSNGNMRERREGAFTQINQNIRSIKDIRRYSKEVLKDPNPTLKIQQFQQTLTKDDFIKLNIEVNALKRRLDQEKQAQMQQIQLNIEKELKVQAERQEIIAAFEEERRRYQEHIRAQAANSEAEKLLAKKALEEIGKQLEKLQVSQSQTNLLVEQKIDQIGKLNSQMEEMKQSQLKNQNPPSSAASVAEIKMDSQSVEAPKEIDTSIKPVSKLKAEPSQQQVSKVKAIASEIKAIEPVMPKAPVFPKFELKPVQSSKEKKQDEVKQESDKKPVVEAKILSNPSTELKPNQEEVSKQTAAPNPFIKLQSAPNPFLKPNSVQASASPFMTQAVKPIASDEKPKQISPFSIEPQPKPIFAFQSNQGQTSSFPAPQNQQPIQQQQFNQFQPHNSSSQFNQQSNPFAQQQSSTPFQQPQQPVMQQQNPFNATSNFQNQTNQFQQQIQQPPLQPQQMFQNPSNPFVQNKMGGSSFTNQAKEQQSGYTNSSSNAVFSMGSTMNQGNKNQGGDDLFSIGGRNVVKAKRRY